MTDAQYQTALSLFGQGRHAEGARMLGDAAGGGHVPAMSMLGHQMLSGRGAPLNPIEGVRLIMAAANRDGGFACALAAMLLAAGVSGQPDWPRALDYLQRSAELGFGMAQAQLRVLAGRAGGDWGVLRRDVDIQTWRQTPRPRPLSAAPRIQAFEGVATPFVCEWLIARARDGLRPAQIYDTTGGGALSNARSNSATEFGLADVDLVLLALRERLGAAAGLSVMQMDAPQVLHYAVGQAFRHHVDFFDPAIPHQAAQLAGGGQRIATVLVYLNDQGLQGGDTEFPLLDLRHRGRRGDALVFFNVDGDGQPDRRTVHAGLPPTAGEKWLLSQWIRDRVTSGAGDPGLIAALNGR